MTKQCLSAVKLSSCGRQAGFLERESGELEWNHQGGNGIFVSRTYDSGAKGTEWNRIVLDISLSATIQVYVWIFEDYSEAEAVDRLSSVPRQLEWIKARAQYVSNYREVLLYGQERGRGRYARLAVEIPWRNEDGAVLLRGYALSFPRDNFSEYLPVIYRGNLQLDRYLAVQQSGYLELEEKIDTFVSRLDSAYAEADDIKILASWMGWGELTELAEEETLRRLLRTGVGLSGQKGTCAYFLQMAQLLTGQEAVLMEEQEKHRAMLLIKGRPSYRGEQCLKWLKGNVPIGIQMDIVILHRTQRLDGQYFLDETAYLSETESSLSSKGVSIDGIRLQ